MRFRIALLLLLLCGLLAARPVVAQSAASSAAPVAAAAGDAPAPPASPDDVNRLIRTLQDPAARADLVKELQALLAAQKQAAPEAPLGDELGQELLRGLSDALAGASELLGDAIEGLGNPAHILHWLEHKIDDPEWRAAWKDALLKLAIVLGGGVVAGALTGWLVVRPMRSLAKRTPARPWQRIGPLFARSLLDLAPTLAFAAVAYGALVGTAPHEPARLAALAIINAALIAKLVLTVARFLISPYAPALRLVPLLDETAAYLDIWLHRLVLIAVYGFLALQAGAALGMPHGVHLALFNLFGLLLTLLLIAFVLQNRQAIARGLRGRPAEPDEVPDPFHRLRHHAGNYWHIFAVVYLVAIYLVWALRVKDGFVYVLRGSVTTLLILLVAALLIRLGRRAWDKMLEVNGELLARYPLIEYRANRYLPYIKRALILAVQIGALLALLAAWQIDVVGLLQSDLGRLLLSRLAGIAVVIGLSLLVWEVSSGLITIYLQRRDETGQVLLRSARARTLLPLVRNALLIVISVMALLTVLSQLGIDISPLLAGAGVVGLAIGFGAQTLVKDVITGAFILFEDTVNVGDVATINGTGGLVEGMTIRTIRLRDLSGTVHTIPFGSINAISNLTKDYSYYLLDIGVAYRENTDEVLSVMRAVFEDLRQDAAYSSFIIGDFEVLGVDRFADSAVYVRARIKTIPIKQWDVGREYNRRLKLKFDELGIEIPFPHHTIYFGADKQGKAPPVRFVPADRETESAKSERSDGAPPVPPDEA